MTELMHVTTEKFDSALALPGVLVVDFWATWCMPCKMVAPVMEKIADHYAGKLVVAKVDIDEEPDLAARFAIQSIPTVAIFKDGKLINSLVGAHAYDSYVSELDKLL